MFSEACVEAFGEFVAPVFRVSRLPRGRKHADMERISPSRTVLDSEACLAKKADRSDAPLGPRTDEPSNQDRSSDPVNLT